MALKGATWPSDLMSLFGAHDRNVPLWDLVPQWDLGIFSLFGIMARILGWFLPCRHSCLFTPANFGVGCWFFLRHPNFPFSDAGAIRDLDAVGFIGRSFFFVSFFVVAIVSLLCASFSLPWALSCLTDSSSLA